MNKLAVFILMMMSSSLYAQEKTETNEGASVRLQCYKLATPDFRWIKTAPFLTNAAATVTQPSFVYWQGSSYTRSSGDGRFRSTYSFDVQGTLRESKASYSLKKSGILSYWRVQFSQLRSRPHFIYTIH